MILFHAFGGLIHGNDEIEPFLNTISQANFVKLALTFVNNILQTGIIKAVKAVTVP